MRIRCVNQLGVRSVRAFNKSSNEKNGEIAFASRRSGVGGWLVRKLSYAICAKLHFAASAKFVLAGKKNKVSFKFRSKQKSTSIIHSSQVIKM